MNKQFWFFSVFLLCALSSSWYLVSKAKEIASEIEASTLRQSYFDTHGISKTTKITTPSKHSAVGSPVLIRGTVTGRWFFEGVIVGKVLDQHGTVLGQGPLMAKGDWMTEGDVRFEGIIPFDKSTTEDGFVSIEPDNPKGFGDVPAYSIPIKFKDTDISCKGDECATMCAPGMIGMNGFCKRATQM